MNDDVVKSAGQKSSDPQRALENIVDDEDALSEARQWAYDELTKGRAPEEVAGELRAAGWDSDQANDMAEQARRQTRHLRGVITRDDVARLANDRYRRTMGLRWFSAFVNLICFWRMLSSITMVFQGGRKKQAIASFGPSPQPSAPNTGETEETPLPIASPGPDAAPEVNKSADPPAPT
jgi:hypothetical protein